MTIDVITVVSKITAMSLPDGLQTVVFPFISLSVLRKERKEKRKKSFKILFYYFSIELTKVSLACISARKSQI